ncbi:MAG: GAF domain-containing protein [Pseudolysinimonas sp.]
MHATLGAPAHAWAKAIVRRDAELARPSGRPIAHGRGPDPDRVLVLGSPVVEGIGVASYDLTFSGHLARALASRTGRGADVEVRGIEGFDAVSAASAIRAERLERFDAVLILGGVTEIVTMMPFAKYRRNLQVLFDTLAEHAPATLPVLLAGVAPFMHDMGAPRFVVSWSERRIARQNAVTRQACAESGVAEYVEFAPRRAGIRLERDASAVYESWALSLAPAVAGALALTVHRPAPPQDESARQRALDRLGVVGSPPDPAVDRIVAMARDMLGVDAASLNFIDHDRMWSKATAGISPGDVPRASTICDVTIRTPGVHVIEDVQAVPEFRTATWLASREGIRFYAGYPLEAPGGERIGALCVIGREPRAFSSADAATLRSLALAAQALMWEKPAG